MPDEHRRTSDRPAALTGHVAYLGVELGYRAQSLFGAAMADLDLRPNQYDFLAALHEFGPQSQTQLASRIRLDPARIVGMADVLSERGVVERVVDPTDRRKNLVGLTPAGESLFESARQRAALVEAELLRHLSTDQQAHLRTLLQIALGFRDSPASVDGP